MRVVLNGRWIPHLAALCLALALLAVPHAIEAQPAPAPRIGVLSPGFPGPSRILDAFRRGLRELGYVEGQNIAIEYRFDEEKPERLADLAAELVRLKVNVILTVNTAASQAAKNATKTIPIVFTYVADPAPLVASLARPGANITGLTTLAAELSIKRLELLKEALPGLSRVAYLWNSANPTATHFFKETERASPRVGIQLHPLGVKGLDELSNAFKLAIEKRAGAVFVWEDALLLPHRTRILDLAAAHRLPAASQYREFSEAGGFLSYGPNLPEQFRRAAIYVDRILKGARAGDLPVEQPTKFELVVNMKTAKTLGLTVPTSLLIRADQVIE
ncbi:MAG TPA: ABC transporter substrate-binding protein [Terriglobales bacterium]|nr:ABC transporter substrate-binding protein [Terriglobales bacterium]